MKIVSCRINHACNPLGQELEHPTASWKVTETRAKGQRAAQIVVKKNGAVVYDSGEAALDSLATPLSMPLAPRTRYTWTVRVIADNGEEAVSPEQWFETAKLGEPWQAQWIGRADDAAKAPMFRKRFPVSALPGIARLYGTGLGMYEISLNGQKLGDGFLAPGCTVYTDRVQYQTYDLAPALRVGENLLEVRLGDGWYKGRYGLAGKADLYGSRYELLAEVHLDDAVFGTGEDWEYADCDAVSHSIYDGERFDPGTAKNWRPAAVLADCRHPLIPQEAPLPSVGLRLPAREVLATPSGRWVVDFGQNMAGFAAFTCREPAGTTVRLLYGEILQDGELYQGNLGAARQEFVYVSDGTPRTVQPHFTWFGFRYLLVEGMGRPEPDDFTACALSTPVEDVGRVITANEKLNRLIENARWGERSNYMDIPTDCPQRAERLGWTADTQVFTGTACYFTDAYRFLAKYCRDIAAEQSHRGGAVPDVVPAFGEGGGCSVWGDAATIIPWTLYQRYGDRDILARQYPSMKAWVDFIRGIDEKTGNRRLWTTGFHYGDWLALDNESGDTFKGGTEDGYIASAYYRLSAGIVARSAAVLGKPEDAAAYKKLEDEILSAIRAEYFTPNGRCAVTTQCGYVLALAQGLCPDKARDRTAQALEEKLKQAGMHLKTGFVGTPFLCGALSGQGHTDAAYRLLLNEDYPGWLYAVNLGATTIWERWNSVLPDGKINPTNMNSLNHYSYGSVVEWIFREMAGLAPDERGPGFRLARIAPKPNWRVPRLEMRFDSPAGLYTIRWEIGREGDFALDVTVPFGAEAELTLPGSAEPASRITAGSYHFRYLPDPPLKMVWSAALPLASLLENPACRAALEQAGVHPQAIPGPLQAMPLQELRALPFVSLDEAQLAALDKTLRAIR